GRSRALLREEREDRLYVRRLLCPRGPSGCDRQERRDAREDPRVLPHGFRSCRRRRPVPSRRGRRSGCEPSRLPPAHFHHARPVPSGQRGGRAAYQWWLETVGVASTEDLWLSDGAAYYSAALYLANTGGPTSLKEEVSSLAVLGLKFENKSAVRNGLGLGYRSE